MQIHHHHLIDPSARPSYISNDLLADAAIDCQRPPAPFLKRATCCRPLFERPERVRECVRAHLKHEHQLRQKIARQRFGGGDSIEPHASLFDCYFENRNNTSAGDDDASATTTPSWLTTEYADNARTTATTSTAATTNQDNGLGDDDAAAAAAQPRSFEDLRAATVDVLLCALGVAGAEVEAHARWMPVIKRSFDVCQRAYNAAAPAERDQYARVTGGACDPAGLHVLVCMSERMFVECPRADWAQEGDGELFGVCWLITGRCVMGFALLRGSEVKKVGFIFSRNSNWSYYLPSQTRNAKRGPNTWNNVRRTRCTNCRAVAVGSIGVIVTITIGFTIAPSSRRRMSRINEALCPVTPKQKPVTRSTLIHFHLT